MWELYDKETSKRIVESIKEDRKYKWEKFEEADSFIEKAKAFLTSPEEYRMKKRKEQFKNKIKADFGDIIGVKRMKLGVLYEHYGIYINDNSVIHYNKSKNSKRLIIMETDISEFLGDKDRYFILDCEKDKFGNAPKYEVKKLTGTFVKPIERYKPNPREVYSPEETVARARQFIGKGEYNLFTRNCEHFAIWCKTGMKESYQIDKLLEKNRGLEKWITY